ncbi:hypothetical protein TeGR_g8525, partial [Tetraparma gracilis]
GGGSDQRVGVSFDETGRLLLYPTVSGIKVLDVENHRIVRTLGGPDCMQARFLSLCVLPTDANVDEQMALARGGASGKAIDHSEAARDAKRDPMVLATAFGKKRFYVFSKFDPVGQAGDEDGGKASADRDVLNEPPDAEDMATGAAGPTGHRAKNLPGSSAILRTTMGDVHFKIFGSEVPKTAENFCTHAKNGYYDNVIFHRVIK